MKQTYKLHTMVIKTISNIAYIECIANRNNYYDGREHTLARHTHNVMYVMQQMIRSDHLA